MRKVAVVFMILKIPIIWFQGVKLNNLIAPNGWFCVKTLCLWAFGSHSLFLVAWFPAIFMLTPLFSGLNGTKTIKAWRAPIGSLIISFSHCFPQILWWILSRNIGIWERRSRVEILKRFHKGIWEAFFSLIYLPGYPFIILLIEKIFINSVGFSCSSWWDFTKR